ncbi:unnamed protein product, partial [Bubo scandiacus]
IINSSIIDFSPLFMKSKKSFFNREEKDTQVFVWICVVAPKMRIWPGNTTPCTKYNQKR